jgi:hypothetical protein
MATDRVESVFQPEKFHYDHIEAAPQSERLHYDRIEATPQSEKPHYDSIKALYYAIYMTIPPIEIKHIIIPNDFKYSYFSCESENENIGCCPCLLSPFKLLKSKFSNSRSILRINSKKI